MKFSLIICGYNEAENIDACIQSCLNQDYQKDQYEILYVDNNSIDGSLEEAKKYPIITLSETKQGLSEARNCGIRHSKGDVLVFLDVDLILDRNYLKYHEKTFSDPSVGAGGGKVLPLISTWISNYLGVSLLEGYPRFKQERYVRTYPGCNLSIRKSVIEEVGVFAEGLKTADGITRFAEDKEMCGRIRERGYKILYNPKAIVSHKNTHTFAGLVQIWWKGSKGRLALLHDARPGPNQLFSYNVPIFVTLFFLASIILIPYLALPIFLITALVLFTLSTRAYIATGEFFTSYFVKPWMDPLSLLVVNCAILRYKILQ